MSEQVESKSKGKRPPKPKVEKNNVVLDQLDVIYLPVNEIKPNSYNPNRQSQHDFELLCKSIAEDGFTQPIVVLRATKEIVDGEHRWRACKALGYDEVPCVLTDMTPEQMRIATLRHNRARGSEDANLAADVLKSLAEMGDDVLAHAQDSLQMDDVEIARLTKELSDKNEVAQMEMQVPESMLGPAGKGQTQIDKTHAIDHTADETRAKEKILAQAKAQEEKKMQAADANVYRLMLFFTGEEAKVIKAILEQGDGAAQNLLRFCQEEVEAGRA